MEEDEYESLPEAGVMTHMMAGAAAGILEHCVMYPVDSVKTRMQSLVPDPRADYRNLVDAFVRIFRTEGIGNTMRGIDATAYGSGPAHAVYFAMYEYLKKSLSHHDQPNHFAHGIAGCGATVVHDIVYNPFEVIKQRLQVYATPYRSWVDCTQSIIAKEGWRAFYYSFSTQLLLNIPYNSLHFITYEVAQDLANPDRQYKPLTHIFSGAVAGAVAAGLTTPFDVCKTLLNTQESSALKQRGENVQGIVSAVRTIHRLRGFSGFFAGATARVIFQIPSTAIAWFVYEFFKYALMKEWHRNHGGQNDGAETLAKIVPPGVVAVSVPGSK